MDTYTTDSQLLGFDGLYNARELGGMPLKDGKVFNTGVAIRSDSPSELTREQALKIRDYGVTQVIDLRSESEVRNYGNVFEKIDGVDFYNVPLFLGDPDDVNDPMISFLRTHKLGDFYVIILDKLGDRVVDIMRKILNNQGITLFHCAHGKDRTGVISAILYLLAGAPRDLIIKNYAISYEYMKPILVPLIENSAPDMKHLFRSDAENMVIFLDYIDQSYKGDISLFLKRFGMTDEELVRLRAKIVG